MIRAIRSDYLKTKTKEVLDLAANGDTFIVSRPQNKNAVILSENEYNRIVAAATVEAYRAQTIQELDEAVKSLDDPDTKWFTTQEAKKMVGL